ncbi:ribonuclease H-like domain containing nuclease [Gammaproteobacteria bacterium]
MNNSSGTILGFDFGLRRIGVAVGQTLTGTATPLQTLRCTDGRPDWEVVTRLIAEWSPIALVVGLPITADGTETSFLTAVRAFVRRLEGRYRLPVHTVDEHLSSREAESRLVAGEGYLVRGRSARSGAQLRPTRREDIDRVAAQVILQTWLADQTASNHAGGLTQ